MKLKIFELLKHPNWEKFRETEFVPQDFLKSFRQSLEIKKIKIKESKEFEEFSDLGKRGFEFELFESFLIITLVCPRERRFPPMLLLRSQSFKDRIHLSGNQTETSKNKGKSIQDPHSANTEAVSICSLLPPETQHRLQRITNFVCPVPLSENFFQPSRAGIPTTAWCTWTRSSEIDFLRA